MPHLIRKKIDVAILDLQKHLIVDTVPHNRQGKLEHYGVDGKTLIWISNFLKTRKQHVVVDAKMVIF